MARHDLAPLGVAIFAMGRPTRQALAGRAPHGHFRGRQEIGDTITTAMSAYIVYEAYRLGAPRHLIARMIGNVALDGWWAPCRLRATCSTYSGVPTAVTCGGCARGLTARA
jgi:hypothetical protein